MLGLDNERELDVGGWLQALPCRVELPEAEADYFQLRGPMPREFAEARRYFRCYYRARAVLRRGDELWHVYTKDISREGIGILAPGQLFPKQSIRLWTQDATSIDLVVSRCLRIQARCYECGTVVTAHESRKAVESLLMSLLRQAHGA